MTDDDKAKLVEAHEKLEKKDDELDAVKAELAELKKDTAVAKAKRGKLDWLIKNPAMLTAFVGVLAGIGTTAENLWSRAIDAQKAKTVAAAALEEEEVEDQSVGKLAEYLIAKQDKVEDTCLAYAEAITSAMPAYQQRKVDNWLVENDFEPLYTLEEKQPSSARPPVRPIIEVVNEPEQHKLASSDNIYEFIQRQIKTKGEDLAVEDLEKVLSTKDGLNKRKHRKGK